ncbi:DUF4169 family protein [Aestuariivirga sp.]|uniref:DUF4169 family protein n=1 Tax=Aestuariivirga sp. TaxID=2650926 RepID=UPI00391B7952
MAEIVSLKLHRKRRERAAKEEKAAENRLAHGRSKTERKLTEALNEKAQKDLDALKRED